MVKGSPIDAGIANFIENLFIDFFPIPFVMFSEILIGCFGYPICSTARGYLLVTETQSMPNFIQDRSLMASAHSKAHAIMLDTFGTATQ